MNGIWGVEDSLSGHVQHYWQPGRGKGIRSLCGLEVQRWCMHQSDVPTCRDCIARKYNLTQEETVNPTLLQKAGMVPGLQSRVDKLEAKVQAGSTRLDALGREVDIRFRQEERTLSNLTQRLDYVEAQLRLTNAGLSEMQNSPALRQQPYTLSDLE